MKINTNLLWEYFFIFACVSFLYYLVGLFIFL